MTSKYLIVSLLLLLIYGMVLYGSLANVVFASPPSFGRQEVPDSIFDYIDKTNNGDNSSKLAVSNTTSTLLSAEKVDPSIDIVTANYYSDGRTLNSTLWFLFPFKEKPSNDVHMVRSYGMLIDVDFNNQTGPGGIDYQIEIRWKNQTWTRVLTEWSKFGFGKILGEETDYSYFAEDGD